MTVVNYATGEIVDAPTEADVRASVSRVIAHAESIWDEWAWQVENQTWTVLGYASWDDMRRGEYGALTSVTAPRAERPELVSRFRRAGLTQKQTADTLGVTTKTVKRDEHPEWKQGTNVPSPTNADDIVDAEIVEAAFDEEVARVTEDERAEASQSHAQNPARPSLKPVFNEAEWTEQDRAEELAANLAAHLSMLFALTDEERRGEYIALWHLGVDHRPVLGQKYVEPKTMRRIADALRTFATEWEHARA